MNDSINWPGWDVVRKIGSGSFGSVYEIQRVVRGRTEHAALKIITIPGNKSEIGELRAEGYDDDSITQYFSDSLERIENEYAVMADMKGHANVVYCDDLRTVQHDDGFGWDIYIKMELLTPMKDALTGAVSEKQVIKLGMDICSALTLCKQLNIVHRDIKPENIFISRDGGFKLGDFGIAKTMEGTTGGTKTGTYDYMAPEVYNNQPYHTAADIYSLGLVLYWLLNERCHPFVKSERPTPSEKMEARAKRFSGETILAPKHGSEALKTIVLKACAYDPKMRYSDPIEMYRELETLLYGGSIPEPIPEPAPAPEPAPEPDPILYDWDGTIGPKPIPGPVYDTGRETVGPEPVPPNPPRHKKKKPIGLIAAKAAVVVIVGAAAGVLVSKDNRSIVAEDSSPAHVTGPVNAIVSENEVLRNGDVVDVMFSTGETFTATVGEDFVFFFQCGGLGNMGSVEPGTAGADITVSEGTVTCSNITRENGYPTSALFTISGFTGDFTVTIADSIARETYTIYLAPEEIEAAIAVTWEDYGETMDHAFDVIHDIEAYRSTHKTYGFNELLNLTEEMSDLAPGEKEAVGVDVDGDASVDIVIEKYSGIGYYSIKAVYLDSDTGEAVYGDEFTYTVNHEDNTEGPSYSMWVSADGQTDIVPIESDSGMLYYWLHDAMPIAELRETADITGVDYPGLHNDDLKFLEYDQYYLRDYVEGYVTECFTSGVFYEFFGVPSYEE